MINKTIIFLLILLAVVLQFSILPEIYFKGAVPNLALVLVVFWVAQEGFEGAFSKVLVLGLLFDILAFRTVGITIICFILVAFGVSSFSKRFLVAHKTWRLSMLLVMVFFATIFNNILFSFLTNIESYLRSLNLPYSLPIFNVSTVLEAVINGIILILVYYPLKKMGKILDMYKVNKVIMK